MSEFAKLFGEGDEQILVMLQSDDEGKPEIRTFFQPPDLGVCSIAIAFDDSDRGWALAEEGFRKMDEPKARTMTNKVRKELLDEVAP
jgi:hypothetical protein